jgi:hypothetical protein
VLGFPFPLLPQSLGLPLQLPSQSSTCLTLISPLLIMIATHCILCLLKLRLSSIQIKVSRNIVQEQRLQMLPKPQGKSPQHATKPTQCCSPPTSKIWWSYNKPRFKKIAQDHSRKVADIEALVNNCTNYRTTRAPSLTNALTHKKGMEMNEGMLSNTCRNHSNGLVPRQRCWGQRTLAEIQQAKDDDPLYQDLGEEETKEAIDKLIVYRQEKKSNSRVTNKGAARDVFVTMEKIEREVSRELRYQLFFLTSCDHHIAPDSSFTHWRGVLCHGYVAQCRRHDPAFVAQICRSRHFLCRWPKDKCMGPPPAV